MMMRTNICKSCDAKRFDGFTRRSRGTSVLTAHNIILTV